MTTTTTSEKSTRSTALRAALIRRHAVEQTLAAGGGYLSQACSAADILASVIGALGDFHPSEAAMLPAPFTGVPGSASPSPGGGGYLAAETSPDRFILSPSHYAMSLYCALIADNRLALEALAQFNVDGGTLEMIGAEHSPGCELTTGSFGQALSQAAGIALARRHHSRPGRVWVFLSDGELQEGQTWEAIQFLSHYRLHEITVFVDVNGQQVDGRMSDVMGVEPLQDKCRAFGAEVMRIDGHDLDAIATAATTAPGQAPRIILADTDPCQGIASLRARWPRLHYVRVRNDQDRTDLAADLEHLDEQIDGLRKDMPR